MYVNYYDRFEKQNAENPTIGVLLCADKNDADVFSYGRPPVSIDIITNLKGVEFNDAFSQSRQFDENGLFVRFIHLNNLIPVKKGSRAAQGFR